MGGLDCFNRTQGRASQPAKPPAQTPLSHTLSPRPHPPQVCALISKTAFPVSKTSVGPLNFISLEALLAILAALSASSRSGPELLAAPSPAHELPFYVDLWGPLTAGEHPPELAKLAEVCAVRMRSQRSGSRQCSARAPCRVARVGCRRGGWGWARVRVGAGSGFGYRWSRQARRRAHERLVGQLVAPLTPASLRRCCWRRTPAPPPRTPPCLRPRPTRSTTARTPAAR